MLKRGICSSKLMSSLKHPYFVTHIVNSFNVDDVVSRHNCFLRQPYFDQVVDKVIANIVDGDFKGYPN